MATKDKILKSLGDARTRTFVMLFAVIIIIGIVIAVMRGKDTTQNQLSKQGSQAVGVPANISSTPGSVVSEQYRDLQVAENERRAQEALKAKTSAIPTIIGAVNDGSNANNGANAGLNNAGRLGFGQNDPNALGAGNADPFGANNPFGKSAADRDREEAEARLRAQREQMEKLRLEKERQAELERQRRLAEQAQKEFQSSVQKLATNMKNYAQGAYGDWSKFNTQAYVQGELANSDKKEAATPITRQREAREVRQGGRVIAARKPKIFIKAGTVLFGVMDTAVNSDEPGPVLATVVSGKYQGTKMIGTFTHQGQQQAVVIQFNQMSVPKRSKSMGVQAVAIDPDTARTALATDFDRHLLLRYGSLFASSFIEGYGKAITQQGTTTVSPLTGTTTTSTPPLDNRQIFFAALGQLGSQWAQQTKPFFNTPYTVTVDQGTGVGILFLSDVDVSDEVL